MRVSFEAANRSSDEVTAGASAGAGNSTDLSTDLPALSHQKSYHHIAHSDRPNDWLSFFSDISKVIDDTQTSTGVAGAESKQDGVSDNEGHTATGSTGIEMVDRIDPNLHVD